MILAGRRLLPMAHSERAPTDLAELSSADRYTRVLTEWRRLSQLQLTALEASDWGAFDGLLAEKTSLMEAWQAHQGDLSSLSERASASTRERWEELSGECVELDQRLERIVQHLMGEVRKDQRQFEEERRVARAYQALPKELTPSFHDKKY